MSQHDDPSQHDVPRPTESMVRASAIAAVQRDWMKEHRETQGQHHGLMGPGTSAYANCVLCNPVTMTELQRSDLMDEIEMDLL